MRTLDQALFEHELITLRVIGEWWELDLSGTDKNEAVRDLAQFLAGLNMQQELQFLPPEEKAAVQELVDQGGRAAVAAFNRSFGEVRQMGPGRMEREEPWLDPVSPLEALWYRGFLYRAFDETTEGVLEFYYLPEELLAGFPAAFEREESEEAPVLLPVDEPTSAPGAAEETAVDDLTTLMAVALRKSVNEDGRSSYNDWLLDPDPERGSLLLNLAAENGWLRESETGLRPTRAAVDWLKRSRQAQLFELADAWSTSSWNDLCHTPGIVCEGENWHNDPILARTALLDTLPHTTRWYSLEALTNHIRESNPDFQRPDGNYDTWYIRDEQSGGYLTGFEAWDLVEGRLLRFLLQGPMRWLGLVILAGESDDTIFRLSDSGLHWITGQQSHEKEEQPPIFIHPDASITAAHNADRYDRFQLTRIAELEVVDVRKPFRYRLTPASLALAGAQGMSVERLVRFLGEASRAALPRSVQRAIERWTENGVEARLENVIVLRVNDSAILETIRTNPKTRNFLGESLGDLAVAVDAAKWRDFRAACAQLGLFVDEAL